MTKLESDLNKALLMSLYAETARDLTHAEIEGLVKSAASVARSYIEAAWRDGCSTGEVRGTKQQYNEWLSAYLKESGVISSEEKDSGFDEFVKVTTEKQGSEEKEKGMKTPLKLIQWLIILGAFYCLLSCVPCAADPKTQVSPDVTLIHQDERYIIYSKEIVIGNSYTSHVVWAVDRNGNLINLATH